MQEMGSRGPRSLQHNCDNYLTIRIPPQRGVEKPLSCKAFIDSGNTTYAGSVIDSKFHSNLGLKLTKSRKDPIKTASGKLLPLVGTSQPISFKINGDRTKASYVIRPEVIKGLNDQLNIGATFLQKYKADISFKDTGNVLNINGMSHQLIQTLRQEESGSRKPNERIIPSLVKDTAGILKSTGIKQTEKKNVCWDVSQEYCPTKKAGEPEPCSTKKAGARGSAKKPRTKKGLCSLNKKVSKRLTRNDKLKKDKRCEFGRLSENKEETYVCSLRNVRVNPQSIRFIKTKRLSGETIIEPLEGSMTKHGFYAIPSLHKATEYIAVVNEGEEAIKIHRGQRVAIASPGKECTERIDKLTEGQKGKLEQQEPIEEEEPFNPEDEKFQQLLINLKIEENEILNKNKEMKDDLKRILFQYRAVFSDPDDAANEVGATDLIEFNLKLKPGAEEALRKYAKPRPLHPIQRESLKKQIDKWILQRHIQPCDSPYAAPLVPARKAGGAPHEIRWCADWRNLNDWCHGSSYPLPKISDNLERLGGSIIFSCLDAACAYNTIPVGKESQKYLSFTSCFGTFECRTLPFGPKCAPSTYSRFVDICLSRVKSNNVLAYLDDILVFNKKLEDHNEELRKVLLMHKQAGIKLRPKKTHLWQNRCDYLGHTISREGIEMRKDYVTRILEWSPPVTGKEMSTFLGFVGYYCSFIKKYAELTAEMQSAKKNDKIEWTVQMSKNFEELKAKFNEKPIRRYPIFDPAYPFKLTTDFSALAVAGILSQEVVLPTGKVRDNFIGAVARKATKFEKNYGSCKGELSAIIFAIRKFEHILRFGKFILETDAQSLKYLRSMKNPRGIFFRWIEELAGYQMSIVHKKGIYNTNADALSRSPNHLPEPSSDEIAEQTNEFVQALSDLKSFKRRYTTKTYSVYTSRSAEFINYLANPLEEFLSHANLKKAQFNDPTLRLVRKWKLNGAPEKKDLFRASPTLKGYHRMLKFITIDPKTSILYTRYRLNVLDQIYNRFLIPESDENLHERIFYHSHVTKVNAHFGVTATRLRACERFYWPGMSSYLARKVKQCGKCLAKIKKPSEKDCVHQPSRPGFVGERLALDLVGPVNPESPEGYKYILTAQDTFTSYSYAWPLKTKEAETVAKTFLEKWICIYGTPSEIYSDQGTEFTANVWKQLCKLLQINKKTTKPYSSWSNPVERFHRSLWQMLRIFMERESTDWVNHLSTACFAYNTKVRYDGYSPYELMFGRRCRLPVDLIIPLPTKRFQTTNELVRETNKRFNLMYEYIGDKRETMIHRNSHLYTGRKDDFKENDPVWIYIGRKIRGKSPKMQNSWMGPWSIVRVVNDVFIIVKPSDFQGKNRALHVSRVRHWYPAINEEAFSIPRNIDDMDLFTDQGDELAEDVPLGEQIIDQIDPQELLEAVPDPPLPISYNPVPQYIIKDVKNLKAISKSRNKKPSEEEEQDLPLNLVTSTPSRASEVEMESPSGGAKSLSPSKVPLPDDSMEETPIREPEDRGTKRKDVTPARVPITRKAKLEIFKRASSLTPLPYQKPPKTQRKSILQEAKGLVNTPSPSTEKLDQNLKASSSSSLSKIKGITPVKSKVKIIPDKEFTLDSTRDSDSDHDLHLDKISEEHSNDARLGNGKLSDVTQDVLTTLDKCSISHNDNATNQYCNKIPQYCTNVIRATKNVTIHPWADFQEIPCQILHDIPEDHFATISESIVLQRKGLFLRPALFEQKENNSVFALNTQNKVLKISKGQRIGHYMILRQ